MFLTLKRDNGLSGTLTFSSERMAYLNYTTVLFMALGHESIVNVGGLTNQACLSTLTHN